jgi:hypothetical protein
MKRLSEKELLISPDILQLLPKLRDDVDRLNEHAEVPDEERGQNTNGDKILLQMNEEAHLAWSLDPA